jgi:DNA-binding CsgD family transcriptional regulator
VRTIAAPALVERESELDQLDAAIERATAGSGEVVLVEGPAGIGKSRLLAELAARAAGAGCSVSRARGAELEVTFPFGVLRQLIEPLVAKLPEADRDELLASVGAPVRELVALDTVDHEPGSRRDSFPVVHGAYWTVASLADRGPVALVVDDAQLSDEESLAALAYLARRAGDHPIVLAVAVRLHEPRSSLAPLEAIRSADETRLIRPRPLTQEGSRAMVRDVFGVEPEDGFAEACHELSGGNPLLLRELARTVAADGAAPVDIELERLGAARPERVTALVERRLRQLGPSAQTLAGAIAVLGADVELRHAAALADLDPSVAASAADELLEAGLLETVGRLCFVHPLVRGAVYAGVPPTARALMHAAAARLLACEDAPPERLAAHLLEAPTARDPWVVDRLRRAATRALDCGAAASAAAYLARALAEPRPAALRSALLHELGSAEARTGAPAAVDHLREALDTSDERSARVEVSRDLALALATLGRTADAVEVLERALAVTADRDAELALVLEGELLGYAQFDLATFPLMARRLEGRALPSRPRTAGERVILAYRAAVTPILGGSLEEAGRIAEQALGGGALLGEQTADAATFYTAVHMLVEGERFDVADAALDAALDDARARGSVLGFAIASTQRASVAYLRGAVDVAEMEVRTALDAAREAGWQIGLPMTISSLVEVLVERGRLREADELLASAGMAGDVPELLGFNWLLWSRGRLRLAQGEVDRGLDDLFDVGRRHAVAGLLPAREHWRAAAAPALAARGERERAVELAEEGLRLAGTLGTARLRGIALRGLGLATGGDPGIEMLREAETLLAACPARLEHARTLVELGAALRRANRRSDAQETLTAARPAAVRCSADALVARADEELAALGVRTPRRGGGGARLTPSELRVARMAAGGMSNPQVAQALFVSRKTVEKHLSNAYGKLAIGSREELADALRLADPTEPA